MAIRIGINGFGRIGRQVYKAIRECRFKPCIPPSWPGFELSYRGFELSYRYRSATYRILVDNSAGKGRGVRSVELDGQLLPDDIVPLADDSKTHEVRVQLG